MPMQLLTLILCIAMGAMGSLIFLTIAHLDPSTNRPFLWYLFRPFLGMATAVTILICVKAGFVFAIAGQLTISDNSASQGISENLNPYFVSFIGIISGLLSEHATARIRKAGLAFFKGEEERRDQVERWAVGLGTEMIKQNKTVADLLPFVNVPEEIVKEWIDERRSIPPDMQGIIAAWIDVPIRQLFTDLQPAHTEEERNQVPID